MSRALWWASVVAAMTFTAWAGITWTVAEVSLSCAKIGESQSSFRCDDRIVHVLGIRPLVGLGLLLATPPAVAASAMRRWTSWSAVAALVGLSIAGLANWSSFWDPSSSPFPWQSSDRSRPRCSELPRVKEYREAALPRTRNAVPESPCTRRASHDATNP
ncbi:hypothetical protein [Rhodococcus sp. SGAir0479]|uniref:hypothetical protein n=1 Tax=Rhodococcus sp. SGAir0479 TaxID=2567884 RepID=UPI0020C80C97|nr:hypothetical protein [Rhodococcus sp. SGAir0479]